MLKNLLKSPLLLRRLVKSNERIAQALEDIRDAYFLESGRTPPSPKTADLESAAEEDYDALSYTTDASSFDALYGERSRRTISRFGGVPEEDDSA